MEYLINVCLTNGDVFSRSYATEYLASLAFFRLQDNPLVLFASLHDGDDNELAIIDNCAKQA